LEWWLILSLILGAFIVLMLMGLPVAFAFMLVNLMGAAFFWGGETGLLSLIGSIRDSVSSFILLPVCLFVLMGEVLFHSGIAPEMLEVLNKWLGRLPGRLSLLAVGGGTLFAALSGSSMGSIAILGSVLVPEMEKHGYKKPMTLGPILGSGGLAIMIPPTALGVLLAALAQISVGKLLIAIIIPGLVMAVLYASYIIVRCLLQPSIAPAYEITPTPLLEKLRDTGKYVLPAGFIIFLVTGVIFLGIATPTEAAASGAIGTFILAACYRRLNWQMLKKSVGSALQISVMMLIIIAGAKAFSQILAFSGASKGLIAFVLSVPLTPILIIIAMQIILLFMGTFMEIFSIMMITIPIFMPIITALGFDPLWFGVIMLLNMEMATTSPPFGLSLFVMKGVAPPDTTMGDIYKGALPFLGCDVIAIALMLAFPILVLWLPSMM